MRRGYLIALGILGVACASSQSGSRCAPEAWEGECQLSGINKVEDAEFPTPHVVLEATYQPMANAAHPSYTPGALTKKSWVKSQYELQLYDYLEAHPRVACRTAAPASHACVAPSVEVALADFDPQTAASTAAAPPITGCAQIESTSTQDKLQGGQSTQTFVSQRIKFAQNSAELPPDADALTGEVAQLLKSKPGIECLGVVGQISMGEPPALAEQRAKAVRDLLGAHGVALSRLITIGVTAKVFGNGSRPEDGDPADRKVGFSVLLEQGPKP